jgi:hypothetical protein
MLSRFFAFGAALIAPTLSEVFDFLLCKDSFFFVADAEWTDKSLLSEDPAGAPDAAAYALLASMAPSSITPTTIFFISSILESKTLELRMRPICPGVQFVQGIQVSLGGSHHDVGIRPQPIDYATSFGQTHRHFALGIRTAGNVIH